MNHTQKIQLLDAAGKWAAQDPDPQTQEELQLLIQRVTEGDALAFEDISERFSGVLEFGTAGLRAELGAGPMRMNRVVVMRTAAGIARFLSEQANGQYTPKVVIGFDARFNSDVFAQDSAGVFAAAGFEVLLMPSALPTPVLAWAVREFSAEAGVMVTASHNPPRDNGYKVYVGGRITDASGRGAQIVSPIDAQIASLIDHEQPVAQIPRALSGWQVLPAIGTEGDIEAAYLASIHPIIDAPNEQDAARKNLRIVVSAMHGVGGHTMRQALLNAGFPDVHMVAEQEHPDPIFPTVKFPNPEEPGAIDLSLELARKVGADLVIANDPDADRCAAAILDGDAWRMLRGDEVGWLLGDQVSKTLPEGKKLANSIVSSRMLAAIAKDAGREHEETLTGFKWISRVEDLGYGYEEALGYCVAPELVRDKDGISAGIVLADLAAQLKADGSTISVRLDELAAKHGVHVTDQLSLRFTDLAQIPVLMDKIRKNAPASLGGSDVSEVTDLSEGTEKLPATNAMVLHTFAGARVIVRPSGTEPKLKCYLETIEPVDDLADVPEARKRATAQVLAIKDELAAYLNAN
ncbi:MULTISPECIES: phospho-sugar mutase [Glutamicibacter]|uniref:Alpha-D-phosphohexomutase family protein n=1 Tax=Glutamicibacter arilaitensis (strain DSM 16368 / CIP 108037 / IAM 15318 / JCM 13566 / NCIMB 14258 / Re117) TaxID=861360 RepID=A0ABM9PUV5_GLUAR|nr:MULTISPECIES: phospho-sugar mutase [Glutamicibacter]CBT75050.1 alpha-D-phosphohexomutase family protein [Glutamicibacter arilaitensis Re117]HCH48652.1 phospho-sugar mutase [Glutamicibacter sp.]HCJ55030.1 phospho-sugar mutase [Glutamicibacter sp.]